MYCKYCGKQIDDDSKFCKECGRNIGEDASSQIFKGFSFEKLKSNKFSIIAIVIWYALTIVFIFGFFSYNYNGNSYSYNPAGIVAFLWITPLIYYLIYNVINKYSKFPVNLWNPDDKVIIRSFKVIYIIYSYFLPLLCSEKGVEYYLSLMLVLWLLPTIIFYLIYYYISSKSQSKA